MGCQLKGLIDISFVDRSTPPLPKRWPNDAPNRNWDKGSLNMMGLPLYSKLLYIQKRFVGQF